MNLSQRVEFCQYNGFINGFVSVLEPLEKS